MLNSTKTWQEEFDEKFPEELHMSACFGGFYNEDETDNIKQFITDLRKRDMEALIEMSEELIQTDRYSGTPRAINDLQQLIKEYYEK